MQTFAKCVLLGLLVNILSVDSETLLQQRTNVMVDSERVAFPDGSHYHHHHHHHHDHHDHDYDDNNFEARSRTEPPVFRNAFENVTKIPLDFVAKLNDNSYTVNDLLLHYVDDYEDDFIKTRFGEEERSSVQMAKTANCMPELTTVKIAASDDPSILYIPSCTRVDRCGGCCTHSLLSCQPTDVETVNVQVIQTKYTGASKLKFVKKEIIQLEKHKKCTCDCRVQAKDCTPMQEYRKNECRCACRNRDEEKKCYKNNVTRLWNPESCTCQCKEEAICSTGTIYDWNQCRCVLVPMKRRDAVYPAKRMGYESKAMPVIPLQEK